MDGGPACAAARLLDFLAGLPLLTPCDKRGVLRLIQGLDPSRHCLVARSGHGVSVFRSPPPAASTSSSSSRIYRVTGMGEVAADPRVVFELLCNLELIPEWDLLFKSATYLDYAADPAGACEVATIHLVYGLPGVSRFVSDRDFVLRVARVFFPNGTRVLHCASLPPDEAAAATAGLPPSPHVIRGHMWASGYVVVPTSAGCCLNVTLQVDPKGWIPTSVVNWSLEAVPLNITRVRAALARLDPALLALLPDLNRLQAGSCAKQPCTAAGARAAAAAVGPPAAATGAGAARQSCAPQQQQQQQQPRGQMVGGSAGGSSSEGSNHSRSGSIRLSEGEEVQEEEEEEASEWWDA